MKSAQLHCKINHEFFFQMRLHVITFQDVIRVCDLCAISTACMSYFDLEVPSQEGKLQLTGWGGKLLAVLQNESPKSC